MRPAPALALTVLATLVAAGARGAPFDVGSPAIADGRIGERYSAYGANESPAVSWSGVPAGARSFAVIFDDPDAHGPASFVHWLVWNIPAAVRALPAGLPASASLANPPGAAQGRNGTGGIGYFGPRPPSGVHHYHLRVFALDQPLAIPPGSDRTALGQAMGGHVLASGEVVGTYAAPK